MTPPLDPKDLVAAGYDRIADAYLRDSDVQRTEERDKYTRLLFEHVAPGARVLDLGCGAGVPTTRRLAERYTVTGADISTEQIRRARKNVPGATFVSGDMTALAFTAGAFDAVVAFYSIIHVPRDEQAVLLRAIRSWLVPGGYLLATLGAHDAPGETEPDWLGAPMYWSSFDADANLRMVAGAGLSIRGARLETAEEGGQPVTFLWLLARSSDRAGDAAAPAVADP